MLRSEKMSLHCLLMPRESAWEVLNDLGTLDKVHFVDCEEDVPQFNRPFYQQVRRCDESLQKLLWIENEMQKFYNFYNQVIKSNNQVNIDYCGDLASFHEYLKKDVESRRINEQAYFLQIENEINQKHKFLEQLIHNFNSVITYRNQLVEKKHVLTEASRVLNVNQLNQDNQIPNPDRVSLNFLAGVINADDEVRFHKSAFRVSRGNIWKHFKQIDKSMQRDGYKLLNIKGQRDHDTSELTDPYNSVQKTIFILAYASGQNSSLDRKLRRICEGFHADVFNIQYSNISKDLKETEEQIRNQNLTVQLSEKSINEYFDFYQKSIKLQSGDQVVDVCSYIEYVRLFLHKEKTIQHNLNYLVQSSQTFCKGLIWVPEEDEGIVQRRVEQLTQKKSNSVQVAQLYKLSNYTIDPPTKFKSNDFTIPFQEIVNTYGIPRYREINPALFAISTFPYLFGMMFGDIGHGALLFTIGLYLMSCKIDPKRPSAMDGLVQARYLITLMGLFALYNGLIYNDFMSLPLNLFGSCYLLADKNVVLTHKTSKQCVYPFGIDPVWGVAKNKLSVYNSLKMKTSVVFGVFQMLIGIFLKGLNAINNISFVDFFFEFIPQVVFMCCTFGYMVFLIFMKWMTDYSQNTSKAPSILTYMLDLGLSGGGVGHQQELYKGQGVDQPYLLIAALISVPIMLLAKPIIHQMQHNSHQQHQNAEGFVPFQDDIEENRRQADNFIEKGLKLHKNEKPHEFSEEFVHQVIETIEFVLGSISHTASYLRLWALSLAHSQLAEVFFEKTLKGQIESGSTIGILVGFIVFAMITFAVLMCMDVMECFLHTLRLHWVEFQSKFYKADGYLFKPFSVNNVLSVAAVEKRY
ncbi:V-ATPase A subunit 9-2 isotype of the V0 sector (macronuclear) [Tetrahymena thermophila SB210]|uniref:V-type proton ATPase subunit a n=1 Tax=Tetrahymena thermophila (strain SB210) TaxID=312017 RepID=Q23PU1_TETTS|nr:V-ATPase A subunit 9-2 isotype of the V0 sector [Tetrahymena thermophila SB210]EAR98594.1 V-ATPase A subunit 9-2 isotype of the V0 sector [Tetrahymena thermophila SB210]|eukprot:XP_001018839.1 V-ATPase A subunit 9-2 isotype of the V0 sector [Tetrahymena thermophila SB210]